MDPEDGPAGDFLADYWFNYNGPDELPEIEYALYTNEEEEE